MRWANLVVVVLLSVLAVAACSTATAERDARPDESVGARDEAATDSGAEIWGPHRPGDSGRFLR